MKLRPLCEYDVKELRTLARRYHVTQSKTVTKYRPGDPRRYVTRNKAGLYQALRASHKP